MAGIEASSVVLGARRVDQRHGLLDAFALKEGVVGRGDDIDDRVADREHVVFGHGVSRVFEISAFLRAAAANG